jgi:hypothetical protein
LHLAVLSEWNIFMTSEHSRSYVCMHLL